MLTIIGSGHAGVTLARELRKLAPEQPIRVLSRDDGHYYYKPDLSKAIALGKDADGLIKNTAGDLAAQIGIELLAHVQVRRIDTAAHRIELDDGRTFDYGRLVIATGASPIRVPMSGDAVDTVLTVNDRDDYARFRARLAPGARVLIVGAGLIGCEFANDLAANGYGVDVVDIAAWPLNRLLPEPQGRALEQGLGALGVRWHLGTGVASLDHRDGAIEAVLGDGSRVQADVVLSAVGLRPNVELAREAGIRCGVGIVVDDYLRTDVEDVYAIGDCIEIAGRLLPYILPIAHGARALAATLAGTPTKAKFPAMPVMVKTPVYPVLVNPPPPVEGTWEVGGEGVNYEAIYRDAEGRPVGFALTGAATSKRGAFAQLMPPVHEPA